MAIDERMPPVLHQGLDALAERALIGAAGRWLARGAITVVLTVAGCALMLVVLAFLRWAPLVVAAGIAVASWRLSARIFAGLDEAGAQPPASPLRRLRCVHGEDRPGAWR